MVNHVQTIKVYSVKKRKKQAEVRRENSDFIQTEH